MFKNLQQDLPASLVVFLVALPLCLGISLACGTLPITGLIAGIVGGIVVGAISGSQLSVSGPAAGLTAIVISGIAEIGLYEMFLLSVVLAGVIQLLLGIFKAGFVSDYVPNAVIKGMLAAIGIILILKQIPHFLGDDKDYEGDEAFFQTDGENTFTEIILALQNIEPGALMLGLLSVGILLLLDLKWFKKQPLFKWMPAPLIAVFIGAFLNHMFGHWMPGCQLQAEHLVELPIFADPVQLYFSLPKIDFNGFTNFHVWKVGITLAIVASLESLLSLEAVDKLDPEKRISPNNRELVAQGTGNIVSGLLGGLPVTSVIVRSSANVNAGARTRSSAIFHGGLLLLSVLLIPGVLNLIPKSVLAAILILTGYKLAKVSLFKEYAKKGWDQLLPFLITVIVIVFTDLLTGIFAGLLVGLFFMFKSNFKNSVFLYKNDENYLLRFKNEVSYLSKPRVKKMLAEIPNGTSVLIDATKTSFVDKDIVEIIDEFIEHSDKHNIKIFIKREKGPNDDLFNDPHRRVTN